MTARAFAIALAVGACFPAPAGAQLVEQQPDSARVTTPAPSPPPAEVGLGRVTAAGRIVVGVRRPVSAVTLEVRDPLTGVVRSTRTPPLACLQNCTSTLAGVSRTFSFGPVSATSLSVGRNVLRLTVRFTDRSTPIA